MNDGPVCVQIGDSPQSAIRAMLAARPSRGDAFRPFPYLPRTRAGLFYSRGFAGRGPSDWTMVAGGASLPPRASIGESANVPEKRRLHCCDLRRLCVCRVLERVLRPLDRARGGKLLTRSRWPLIRRASRWAVDEANAISAGAACFLVVGATGIEPVTLPCQSRGPRGYRIVLSSFFICGVT